MEEIKKKKRKKEKKKKKEKKMRQKALKQVSPFIQEYNTLCLLPSEVMQSSVTSNTQVTSNI